MNENEVLNKIKNQINFLMKQDFVFKKYESFATVAEAEKWVTMFAISTLIYTKDEFIKLYNKNK
jgi:hypothetical protein